MLDWGMMAKARGNLKKVVPLKASPSEISQLRGKNQKLEARCGNLEDRCRNLEKELSRVLMLLEKKDRANNKPEVRTPPRANPLFETAWEFYKDNRDKLVKEYCDKYVVISGKKVIAAYEDEDTAYFETEKKIPLGSFLIHHITKKEEVLRLSPFIGVSK